MYLIVRSVKNLDIRHDAHEEVRNRLVRACYGYARRIVLILVLRIEYVEVDFDCCRSFQLPLPSHLVPSPGTSGSSETAVPARSGSPFWHCGTRVDRFS